MCYHRVLEACLLIEEELDHIRNADFIDASLLIYDIHDKLNQVIAVVDVLLHVFSLKPLVLLLLTCEYY